MKRNTNAGFTLIELMVVVVIIAVIASIAMVSVGKRKNEDQIREGSYYFATMVTEARKAAMNYRTRVMFEYTPYTLQWCVNSCTITNTPKSSLIKLNNVKIIQYAREAAITSNPPSHIYNMPNTKRHFYIEPSGILIGYTTDTAPRGITLYFQHLKDSALQFRVAVMPLIGKAKIIDHW